MFYSNNKRKCQIDKEMYKIYIIDFIKKCIKSLLNPHTVITMTKIIRYDI